MERRERTDARVADNKMIRGLGRVGSRARARKSEEAQCTGAGRAAGWGNDEGGQPGATGAVADGSDKGSARPRAARGGGALRPLALCAVCRVDVAQRILKLLVVWLIVAPAAGRAHAHRVAAAVRLGLPLSLSIDAEQAGAREAHRRQRMAPPARLGAGGDPPLRLRAAAAGLRVCMLGRRSGTRPARRQRLRAVERGRGGRRGGGGENMHRRAGNEQTAAGTQLGRASCRNMRAAFESPCSPHLWRVLHCDGGGVAHVGRAGQEGGARGCVGTLSRRAHAAPGLLAAS